MTVMKLEAKQRLEQSSPVVARKSLNFLDNSANEILKLAKQASEAVAEESYVDATSAFQKSMKLAKDAIS